MNPLLLAALTLSYTPSCTSGPCLAGTEIQALEAHRGRLYAGTTHWGESNTRVWPRLSAQVLVLDGPKSAWRATTPLGDPQKRCTAGVAPWEQINDLQSVRYGKESALLASTKPNLDGGCPGLHGTVFHLGGDGQWIDTGLGERLHAFYGGRHSETRYVVSHVDASCPADRPCIFAFVGPRKNPGSVGPTVWRGRIDPGNPRCKLICWDAAPEAKLDGTKLPRASRIVSAYSAGQHGVFIGTAQADEWKDGDRVALLARDPRGRWSTLWTSAPRTETELRGIVGRASPSGAFSLWFLTNRRGAVYRMDLRGGRFDKPKREVELVDVVDRRCTRIYGYQLYLHEDVLAVASQSCPSKQGRTARIFYRRLDSERWRSRELPQIRDDLRTARVNESSIRWLQTSPFDAGDLFLGMTDMNESSGTLTARVYRLTDPFR